MDNIHEYKQPSAENKEKQTLKMIALIPLYQMWSYIIKP